MKQRLSIARVLLHDPKVLLLDEPAGNLDPRARIEMRELLKELRRMGQDHPHLSRTSFRSWPDLCNTVGIIERGELIYSGPVADIVRKARGGTVLHVAVAERQQQAAEMLKRDPAVASVAANNGKLEVALAEGIADYSVISSRLVEAGYRLTLFKEEDVDLETAFMRLTKGIVQ